MMERGDQVGWGWWEGLGGAPEEQDRQGAVHLPPTCSAANAPPFPGPKLLLDLPQWCKQQSSSAKENGREVSKGTFANMPEGNGLWLKEKHQLRSGRQRQALKPHCF